MCESKIGTNRPSGMGLPMAGNGACFSRSIIFFLLIIYALHCVNSVLPPTYTLADKKKQFKGGLSSSKYSSLSLSHPNSRVVQSP